jgi:hypothetical protein
MSQAGSAIYVSDRVMRDWRRHYAIAPETRNSKKITLGQSGRDSVYAFLPLHSFFDWSATNVRFAPEAVIRLERIAEISV